MLPQGGPLTFIQKRVQSQLAERAAAPGAPSSPGPLANAMDTDMTEAPTDVGANTWTPSPRASPSKSSSMSVNARPFEPIRSSTMSPVARAPPHRAANLPKEQVMSERAVPKPAPHAAGSQAVVPGPHAVGVHGVRPFAHEAPQNSPEPKLIAPAHVSTPADTSKGRVTETPVTIKPASPAVKPNHAVDHNKPAQNGFKSIPTSETRIVVAPNKSEASSAKTVQPTINGNDGDTTHYRRGEWIPMLLDLKHLPEAAEVINAYADHMRAEVAKQITVDDVTAAEKCQVTLKFPGQAFPTRIPRDTQIGELIEDYCRVASISEDDCCVTLETKKKDPNA